jgi:hypothetical protein
MKKMIFILMVLAFATMYGQIEFLGFNFEGDVLTPYIGTGTITSVGGLPAPNFFAGSNGTGGNAGRAMNTTQYHLVINQNNTGGMQVMTSTTGLENISISFESFFTPTVPNRLRIMWTTDGSNWTPFNANSSNSTNMRLSNSADHGFDPNGTIINLTGNDSAWIRRTIDFSDIEAVNNQAIFGIRIVAANATGNTALVSVANAAVASGGNLRCDNLRFFHTPANPLPTPTASVPGGILTTTQLVTLSCVDEAGVDIDGVTIFYTTDGSEPTIASEEYDDPIEIADTTTLRFFATKDGFSDSAIVTVTYRFPLEKEDITDLKTNAEPGTGPIYKLSSQMVVTHTFFRTNRWQYYIQDVDEADTIAGILIDDPLVGGNHVIDPILVVGDVISGIVGEYTVFNGMHQFTPVLNTEPDTTGYVATPIVATLDEISTNLNAYQSKLVQVENVVFFPTSTMQNFTVQNLNYTISDGTANYVFRTYFTGVDYLGTPGMPIPFSPVNLTGVISSASGNPAFITARNLEDFDIQSADLILPPKNLSATVDGVDVTLNWNAPIAPGPYFTHAVSETFYSSVGPDDAPGGYDVAHRFTAADLIAMGVAGHTLTHIEFMIDDPECDFTIKVWIGGTWSDTPGAMRNHGQLVRSQEVGMCPDIRVWVTIELDEPLFIPTNRELWIGFYGQSSPGNYPAATDSGPANHGSGNIFQFDNQWFTMFEYNPDLDQNWMIRGIATDINTGQPIVVSREAVRQNRTIPPVVNRDLLPNISLGQSFARNSQPSRQPSALLGYNVYLDGEQINEDLVTETTYFHDNLENGIYVYTVRAIYTGDRVSAHSVPDTANVFVEIVYNPPHGLNAKGRDGKVDLEWNEPKLHELSAEFLGKYNIYRNDVLIEEEWEELTYTDTDVTNDITYIYTVTALYEDESGATDYIESEHSIPATATPVSDRDMLAVGSRLHGNYPNPFNPVTSLQFTVDSAGNIQHVTIDIYNIRGQLVRSLVNSEYATGDHTVLWDGTDDNGRGVSSGIYFYRMTTDNYSSTRKMVLMK